MNTLRPMYLKYENYYLRGILLLTLKQQLDHKSLIARAFDGNALKMKTKRLL